MFKLKTYLAKKNNDLGLKLETIKGEKEMKNRFMGPCKVWQLAKRPRRIREMVRKYVRLG